MIREGTIRPQRPHIRTERECVGPSLLVSLKRVSWRQRVKMADILMHYGWQSAADKDTWDHAQRPDQRIRREPTGWVHLKQDFYAQQGYLVVARGTSVAELEAHLAKISHP